VVGLVVVAAIEGLAQGGVQAVRFLESKILSKERKRRIVVESDRRGREVPLWHGGASAGTEWRIGRRIYMRPE